MYMKCGFLTVNKRCGVFKLNDLKDTTPKQGFCTTIEEIRQMARIDSMRSSNP